MDVERVALETLIPDLSDKRRVEKMEIIQIAPPHRWGGCLAVVDELKAFGVQAYVSVPTNDGQNPGQAFIRIGWDEFERYGVKVCFAPPGS